jgi:hypothetical protein
MTDLLDQNGQAIDSGKENVKNSVMMIESFMLCLENVSVPGRWTKTFFNGFGFLQQMHDQLMAQLTPEEIEEMKKSANQNNRGKQPAEGMN